MSPLLRSAVLTLVLGLGLAMQAAESWAPGGDEAADLEAGMGDSAGISQAEKEGISSERLALGGTFSNNLGYTLYEGRSTRDNLLADQMQAFVYLDSRLREDARMFFKAKLGYSPISQAVGVSGTVAPQPSVSLEEMKLSYNLKKAVFVTLGRQKIKHGSARFWNTTDFLNLSARDYFLPVDERPGVDMLKLHAPFGATNVYGMGTFGGADNPEKLGAYGRVESGYKGLGSVLGGGEVAVSGMARKDEITRYGLDVSQGLGDFDVYGEAAAGWEYHTDQWLAAFTTGISYEWKYTDKETMTFQVEYFRREAGVHYGAFMLYVPKPAGLTDWSWIFYTLACIQDDSRLSRLDTVWQMTRDISQRIYVSAPWGMPESSLRPPYAGGQAGWRTDVIF
jgi:hypothetical protein